MTSVRERPAKNGKRGIARGYAKNGRDLVAGQHFQFSLKFQERFVTRLVC